MTRTEIDQVLTATGRDQTQGGTAEVLSGLISEVIAAKPSADLSRLGTDLEQLRDASHGQTEAVAANTQAVAQNTVAQVSSSGGSKAGSIAKTILGNALGLAPLFSGLLGLFGGEKEEPPAPLVQYVAPAPSHFAGAVGATQEGGVRPVEYDQDGRPRGAVDAGARQSQQVTVQVQAMDSQSFLDHRDEIARAVREAMLNSHSINDVVNEL